MNTQATFIKTSTAGNTTLFIKGKFNDIQKLKLIKQNLEQKYDVEQLGFVWEEDGKVILEMAGGEMCGGAIIASYFALSTKKEEFIVNICEIQIEEKVISTENNKFNAISSFPSNLILSVDKFESKIVNSTGFIVRLDGISFFVTDKKIQNINLDMLGKLDLEIKTQDVPAIGLIIVQKNKVYPYIWVKDVNTLFLEQACITGSIAAELAYPNSLNKWIQPSRKEIEIEIGNKILITTEIELIESGNISTSLDMTNNGII